MTTEPVASGDAESVEAVEKATTDAPAAPMTSAATDVLQVIPRRPGGSLPPPEPSEQDLSLAPMGIDSLARLPLDPENSTGSISATILSRRKRLTRIVVAAIAACGVILVAAGIAHAVRRSDDAQPVTAAAPPAPSPDPSPSADPPAAAPAPVPDSPDAIEAKTKGTIRLDKPASPGHVWLDGKKLSKVENLVACGKHQIKVGAHAHAHAVDVPCGGEVHVSR